MFTLALWVKSLSVIHLSMPGHLVLSLHIGLGMQFWVELKLGVDQDGERAACDWALETREAQMDMGLKPIFRHAIVMATPLHGKLGTASVLILPEAFAWSQDPGNEFTVTDSWTPVSVMVDPSDEVVRCP